MSIIASNPQKRATIDALVLSYRVYTRRIRRMLYLGGVLQDRTHSVIRSYTIGLLIILTCFSHCVFIINFSRDHTDNLVILSKCFALTCSLIAPVLMSACFLVKREKLMELHETLNDLFERELIRDPGTMLATQHTFDRPSFLLCFTLASTILTILCPPLISIVRQIIHHTKPKRYRLPFPEKFPWPVPIDGGILFHLHFLYQIFTCWWMIFTIGGVDSLFGYYAFQISSILRAMSAKLTNPQPQEVFAEILGSCVRTHHRLLRCGHILSEIWGLLIIRMILANAILICALIFEVSPFTNLTANQFFSFVSYMALKLLQTFIYAWYGSLITSASEHFREGIYFSEWPDSNLDRHIRTNVVMMMMQKPMIITALKLSSVNVNMFTNVVNTAASYFFLLQSFEEGG